eukprot:833389-Amphidinium_carterae.1
MSIPSARNKELGSRFQGSHGCVVRAAEPEVHVGSFFALHEILPFNLCGAWKDGVAVVFGGLRADGLIWSTEMASL